MKFFVVFVFVEFIRQISLEKVVLLDTKRDGWDMWRKNTNKFKGWRIQNLPPNGDAVYGVCEIKDTSSDSWLRSPFISRQHGVTLTVRLAFTMRKCNSGRPGQPPPAASAGPHCEETLQLLKYEVDQDTESIEFNDRYFLTVSKVTPNRKWEHKDRTEDILNVHEAAVPVRRAGVILALRNTGSCAMLKEVSVFYQQCPEVMHQRLVWSRTTAIRSRAVPVAARCVEHAVPVGQGANVGPTAYCRASGSWDRQSVFGLLCQCGIGYEPHQNTCVKCNFQYYKNTIGLEGCVKCPRNSHSSMGATRCYCRNGFYSLPGPPTSLNCKAPPGKPIKVNIDTRDQARILISWEPSPQQKFASSMDNKVVTNSSGLFYRVNCTNCPNKLQFLPSSSVYGNKVTVLGALPSREYNFKVTTINEISRYVTSQFEIEQSSAKKSVLTSPLETFCNVELMTLTKTGRTVLVKWREVSLTKLPALEFEVVLLALSSPTELSEVSVFKFPDFQRHVFTISKEVRFTDVDDRKLVIFVAKVRARSRSGWGQFAKFKTVKESPGSSPTFPRPELEEQQHSQFPLSHSSSPAPNSGKTLFLDSGNPSETLDGASKDKRTSGGIDGSGKASPDDSHSSAGQKDVVLLVVGSILLMVVLIVVAVVVIFCMRRQIATFSQYRHKHEKKVTKTKKKVSENHHTNQIIYSSAYSLPRHTYHRYQDPGTYEDISLALQDFTREIDCAWISTDVLLKEGSVLSVYRGTLRLPNEMERSCDVRVLASPHNSGTTSLRDKNEFLREASTMGQFQHDRLLRLEGVVTLTDPFMTLTEPGSTIRLLPFLQANKHDISIPDQLRMLIDVASGMLFLSSVGFIHKDLAARNIMIDNTRVCKIADFGLARMLDPSQVYSHQSDSAMDQKHGAISGQRIAVRWAAPEVVLRNIFTESSDVWSYGVTAWEVLAGGEQPYWQWSDAEVLASVQTGYRLPLPPLSGSSHVVGPLQLHSLLLACWDVRPRERPSFCGVHGDLVRLSRAHAAAIGQQTLMSASSIKGDQSRYLQMHSTLNHNNANNSTLNNNNSSTGSNSSNYSELVPVSASQNQAPAYPIMHQQYPSPALNQYAARRASTHILTATTNRNDSSPTSYNLPLFAEPDYKTLTYSKRCPHPCAVPPPPIATPLESLLAQLGLTHLLTPLQLRGLNHPGQLRSLTPTQLTLLLSSSSSSSGPIARDECARLLAAICSSRHSIVPPHSPSSTHDSPSTHLLAPSSHC